MNSVEDALTFYIRCVFTMHPEGQLSFCRDMWPFLVHFMSKDEAIHGCHDHHLGRGRFQERQANSEIEAPLQP